MARFSDEKRHLTAALIDQGQALAVCIATLYSDLSKSGNARIADRALALAVLEDCPDWMERPEGLFR